MYPSTAKYQTRPSSPQFANFSAPGNYPHVVANTQTAAASVHTVPGGDGGSDARTFGGNAHPSSMSMRHPKAFVAGPRTQLYGSGGDPINVGGYNMMSGSSTVGHHRGDLVFPDDIDNIEFCIPPSPAPSNGINHGVNGELVFMHSANEQNGISESFTERRRRGHNRRSNHKIDVDQQVKWSRKNIAATMERFEPTVTTHSSSSTSSLEYGFAAGVVTPTVLTPSHRYGDEAIIDVGGGHPVVPPPTHNYNTASVAGAPFNHVYSYAYYEPGAAKCHTNIPHKDGVSAVTAPIMAAASNIVGPSKSPPRNSIRALLAKSFRSKSSSNNVQSTSSSPSADDRHTYTTRYGTTENLYEEVYEQKIRKVLSDNRIATSSIGNVKEELRRVQHNHFRVLDELNLSLEALIMPPTPPDISPSHATVEEDNGPSTSTEAPTGAGTQAQVATSFTSHGPQRPRRGGLLGGAASSSSSTTSSQQRTLSHASLENLSTTLNSMELKDHAHSSCINPEFDEGDLDSGFSGSGSSSGASYNESLRYYKTGTNYQLTTNNNNSHHLTHLQNQHNHQIQTTTLPHNLRSCRSSTASGTSMSKSSMASTEDQGISGIGMMAIGLGIMGNAQLPPSIVSGCNATTTSTATASLFNNSRRCSDTQRDPAKSISSSTAASSTGTKPKKNFWTIKP